MEPENDIFEQWAEERVARPWYKKLAKRVSIIWEANYEHAWVDFKTGVNNIIYWLPVIWKDRNWDSHYIFDILSHKLKAQANYISNRNFFVSSKRDAEVMMTCVRLIDKVQNEWYQTEYMDYHKTKHWFEDIPDRPGYSSWESRQLEENFDEYFAKYPLIHKKLMSGKIGSGFRLRSKQHVAMSIATINHNRARKLLFRIMEQNIEKWWD